MRILTFSLLTISISGVLVAGFFYHHHQRYQRIFQQHIGQIDWAQHTQRATTTAADTTPRPTDLLWQQSLEHLQRGESKRAIAALQQLLTLDPDDPNAHLRLGMALLQEGDLTGSYPHLQHVRYHAPDFLQADAAWYLAMWELRNNQPERARPLLEDCIRLRGNYVEEARAVLEKIG